MFDILAEYLYTNLLPDIALVFICECGVDWVKHAFITKFNELSSHVC